MASAPFVVIGAGPAGIRAAEVLAEAGLRPIVIDEARGGGGQIYRQQPASFRRSPTTLYGSEAGKAQALHKTLRDLMPKIDYRPEALAWALGDGKIHIPRTSAMSAGRGARSTSWPWPIARGRSGGTCPS